jgi:hypothetical protein
VKLGELSQTALPQAEDRADWHECSVNRQEANKDIWYLGILLQRLIETACPKPEFNDGIQLNPKHWSSEAMDFFSIISSANRGGGADLLNKLILVSH